jgi:hypothetical protein
LSSTMPAQSVLSSSSTTISRSEALDMGSPFPRALSVSQALPFLRDYTGSRLIIADIRFVPMSYRRQTVLKQHRPYIHSRTRTTAHRTPHPAPHALTPAKRSSCCALWRRRTIRPSPTAHPAPALSWATGLYLLPCHLYHTSGLTHSTRTRRRSW